MSRKIPTILALVAAIVVTCISIFSKSEFLALVIRLIITICVFYGIGFIVRLVLIDIFEPQVEEVDISTLENLQEKDMEDEEILDSEQEDTP